MDIKILGAGCAKCNALEVAIRAVVEEKGLDATVTKIEDIMEIMTFGIMITPALVIDGKVVVKGRVPTTDELTTMITG